MIQNYFKKNAYRTFTVFKVKSKMVANIDFYV